MIKRDKYRNFDDQIYFINFSIMKVFFQKNVLLFL